MLASNKAQGFSGTVQADDSFPGTAAANGPICFSSGLPIYSAVQHCQCKELHLPDQRKFELSIPVMSPAEQVMPVHLQTGEVAAVAY